MGQTEFKREVNRIIGECAGFVSMCWDPKPTGVFDSSLANKQLAEAQEEVHKLIKENTKWMKQQSK